MNVYIYVTQFPEIPSILSLYNPFKFVAVIEDELNFPLDTTTFRCELAEDILEDMNTEIIKKIGGQNYIKNGAIEIFYADIKRLSSFIYSRSQISEDKRLNLISYEDNYEYVVANDQYELMPAHHQSPSESHLAPYNPFDDHLTDFTRFSSSDSADFLQWNWPSPIEYQDTPKTPQENSQSPIPLSYPTSSTTVSTTTTVSTNTTIPRSPTIYETQDSTIWEHNLTNNLVSLVSHLGSEEAFKTALSNKIINTNALSAQQKEDLTAIIFSVLPIHDFQLDIDDFCLLYNEAEFMGNKPTHKLSEALLKGDQTITDTLDDLYEFIENTCPNMTTQHKLLTTLLEANLHTSTKASEDLLTKLKTRFGGSDAFANSLKYFITGLRGLDEQQLLARIFSQKTDNYRGHIHHIFQNYITKKSISIVEAINNKNRNEIIEINDEASPTLLYRAPHKRERDDENKDNPKRLCTNTQIGGEKSKGIRPN